MVLISGTAVGLSLIGWSLHRCWQERRRELVDVGRGSFLAISERHGGEEHAAGEEPAAVAATDLPTDNAGRTTPTLTLPQGGGNEQQAGTVAMKTSNVVAELREVEDVPASQHVNEAEATLFVIGAGMYELKAVAEELPPVQIPRRAALRQVAEQLLLWPDADEPVAEAVRSSDFTTTERRER